MPRSAAQVEASRRNGARSRGPRTVDGKARSRMNACRHGLRAKEPAPLQDGDLERFHELRLSILARWRPCNPVETAICARIAMASWQGELADRMELAFWDDGAANVDPDDPLRLIRAFHMASQTCSLDTIMRYQAKAARAKAQALRDLVRARTPVKSLRRTNEPKAIALVQPVPCTNEPKPNPAPLQPSVTNEPEAAGRTLPVCTNEPKLLAPILAPPLNRQQRRRLAAIGHRQRIAA